MDMVLLIDVVTSPSYSGTSTLARDPGHALPQIGYVFLR
jgi:hypothetical protein